MYVLLNLNGFYGNKHSGYVVNPMAPEHQLPFPTPLPYHLEVITCLFLQKLKKDRSASNLLLHKILQHLIPILALSYSVCGFIAMVTPNTWHNKTFTRVFLLIHASSPYLQPFTPYF